MLKKLLKHELKATNRILFPLYLVVLLISVVTRIVSTLDIFPGFLEFIPTFLVFTYGLSIIIVIASTFIFIILRFFKNFITDEGYLMFTLPVKIHQLINSKLIASLLNGIYTIFIVLFSLFIVIATPERIPLIKEFIAVSLARLGTLFSNHPFIVIYFFILLVTGILNTLLSLYLSISIGQLFAKYKVLASGIAYFAVYTLQQIFMIVVLVIAGFIFFITTNDSLFSTTAKITDELTYIILPIAIIFTLLFTLASYSSTHYIFKNKLNLD